jgi:hypothetical protein
MTDTKEIIIGKGWSTVMSLVSENLLLVTFRHEDGRCSRANSVVVGILEGQVNITDWHPTKHTYDGGIGRA